MSRAELMAKLAARDSTADHDSPVHVAAPIAA
jgi:hypothetical protein